jgi:hypothetical protein
MIKRWSARPVHTPFLLAHRDHSLPSGVRRSEVDMAHFRKGVAHSVVDRALAHLAALDVSYGNPQRQSHRRRSQHFVTISDQQKQVRPHLPEQIRQSQRGDADRLSHAHIGIRTEQTFDAGVDREAVIYNFLESIPEFR